MSHRAPVTPPAAAPHVEAAVLTLVAGAAVVVVGSAGHLVTGSGSADQQCVCKGCGRWNSTHVRPWWWGMTATECRCAYQRGHSTCTRNSRKESECRPSGEANNKHGPPATAPAQAPAARGQPTSSPTHQRTGPCRGHARHAARELGNWYQVLGVRYPGATTEEIKRAYK